MIYPVGPTLTDPNSSPLEAEAASPRLPIAELGSSVRRVFKAEDSKVAFAKFLDTIFYQLDKDKVFALMDEILKDPEKTDEEIYKELLAKIDSTKKTLPIFKRLYSLFVLKKGMGLQAKNLLASFQKDAFSDYLEVYDRRYVKTIEKVCGIKFKGQKVAVCDSSTVDMGAKLQAGALLTKFPYTSHVALNDADCKDPLIEVEKTHKPLGEEIADQSIDLVACLGGLHHVPKERQEAFVASLYQKMRPGSVILFRDHDVTSDAIRDIASCVHTFVNAADKVSWEIENKEIRDFKSLHEWEVILARHGFQKTLSDKLVLTDDPTENGMIAFIKKPKDLAELKKAVAYRNDYKRSSTGPRSTAIEWGNVRYTRSYASYIKDKKSYGFDYFGHMRQHYEHFKYYVRECRKEGSSIGQVFFSEDFLVSFFILATASIQLAISGILALPSRAIARCRFGQDYRSIEPLNSLDRFMAEHEMAYANFIKHTPFYEYPWLGQVRKMWSSVWSSKDSIGSKMLQSLSCVSSTISFTLTALISKCASTVFGTNNPAPEVIHLIVKDPNNHLETIKAQWDKLDEKNVGLMTIRTLLTTDDHHKLISIPRYYPQKDLLAMMRQKEGLELIEMGGRVSIPVDVVLSEEEPNPSIDGAKIMYQMPILQDEDNKRIVTFEVEASRLFAFEEAIGVENIDYIHE